jgi:hypothetical protein
MAIMDRAAQTRWKEIDSLSPGATVVSDRDAHRCWNGNDNDR